MLGFISWSGGASKQIAEALREWLPNVYYNIEPWVSSYDIDLGRPGITAIGAKLEEASCGILCVTADNQEAPWLNFEAGALSKAVGKSFVIPLLHGLDTSELRGPISNFQAHTLDSDGVRRTLTAINRAFSLNVAKDQLDRQFEQCWPQLADSLNHIPKPKAPTSEQAEMREAISRIELAATLTEQHGVGSRGATVHIEGGDIAMTSTIQNELGAWTAKGYLVGGFGTGEALPGEIRLTFLTPATGLEILNLSDKVREICASHSLHAMVSYH